MYFLRVNQIFKYLLGRPIDGRVVVRLRTTKAVVCASCTANHAPQRQTLHIARWDFALWLWDWHGRPCS